eukprot:scaffold33715_cov39-Cyclotella_meneghiniana.AAC.6
MTILIHEMSCRDRIRGVLSHGSPLWLAPDLLCYLGAPAFSFSFSSFATSVAGQHGSVSEPHQTVHRPIQYSIQINPTPTMDAIT